MGIAAEKAEGFVLQLPQLMRGATSASDALLSLVEGFRTIVPSIWRASIRKLVEDGQQLEIVAVWSAVETSLTPGVRMSILATSFPDVLKDGHAIVSADTDPPPFLDSILSREGVASWVSIPLRLEGRIVGLLSFSSIERHSFDAEDLRFFNRLGTVVESRLVQLME